MASGGYYDQWNVPCFTWIKILPYQERDFQFHENRKSLSILFPYTFLDSLTGSPPKIMRDERLNTPHRTMHC